MMYRIGFRVDANSAIGYGHLMRCLTLARAFSMYGAQVVFIVRDELSRTFLVERTSYQIYLLSGVSLAEEIDELRKVANFLDISCIIIDSYQITSEFLIEISKIFKVTGYVDDLNEIAFHGDFLLNGNIYAESLNYEKHGKAEYLLGSQYTLLREEFMNLPERIMHNQVKRVLLSFGGSDVLNLTPRLIQVLKQISEPLTFDIVIGNGFRNIDQIVNATKSDPRFVYHFHVQYMSKLMVQADFAIVACGSTMYELAATGTPSLCLIVAKNQEKLARAFDQKGLTINIGWYDQRTDEKLLDAINRMINNFAIRQEMSRKGTRIVDGEGAIRAVQKILQIINRKGF